MQARELPSIWRRVALVCALALVAGACAPFATPPPAPEPPAAPPQGWHQQCVPEAPVAPRLDAVGGAVTFDDGERLEFVSAPDGALRRVVVRDADGDSRYDPSFVGRPISALPGNQVEAAVGWQEAGKKLSLGFRVTDSGLPDGDADTASVWVKQGEGDDAETVYERVGTVDGDTVVGDVDLVPGGVGAAPEVRFAYDVIEGARPPQVRFDATGSWDPDGDQDRLEFRWDFGDVAPAAGGVGAVVEEHEYGQGGEYRPTLTVTDATGATTTCAAEQPIVVPDVDPVDAPELAEGAPTSVADATSFLYQGDDPVQTGVDPDDIDADRAAVVRGFVRDDAGDLLEDVRVSVAGHPELGRTRSRANGAFDLAVNGGGPVTIVYEHSDYLRAERRIDVTTGDYNIEEDVTLVAVDDAATDVDLSGDGSELQVHEASQVDDVDGARTAVLMFPEGTTGTMVVDGEEQPLDDTTVRATEYTVGENGPSRMPAELPPGTAYQYAIEFSLDEALTAGATEVRFDRPVAHYVENFLHFPVGTLLPLGVYDPGRSAWVAEPNGRVVEIVGEVDGRAQLDFTSPGDEHAGDGVADDPAVLDLADDELAELADRYEVGDELWRTSLAHFSQWGMTRPEAADVNHNSGCAPGEECPPPECNSSPCDPPPENDCSEAVPGSEILCESQVLGEQIDLVGVSPDLRYSSERMPGYRRDVARIPLSTGAFPTDAVRVEVEVHVAGKRICDEAFDPRTTDPATVHECTWDGTDAYGRAVSGAQRATVRLGYSYRSVYQAPAPWPQTFGRMSGVPISAESRDELTMWREWPTMLTKTSDPASLGGWTFDVHHVYDPAEQTLYYGDGSTISAEQLGWQIDTAVGTGEPGWDGDGGGAEDARLDAPWSVDVAEDGTVYVADFGSHRVRAVAPDGTISCVTGACGGAPSSGFNGDHHTDARGAKLWHPQGIAVGGPDGDVYIADTFNDRVRRVDVQTGALHTIAGGGSRVGDGGPAVEARLVHPVGIDVADDGTVYVVDQADHRVRAIGTDGIITTLAGTGAAGFDLADEGGPAIEAQLSHPSGVAVGLDGDVYIADAVNYRIRRVDKQGVLGCVAGCHSEPISAFEGDGGPARDAKLLTLWGIHVDDDGAVYTADAQAQRVRVVTPDGIIDTAAGGGGTLGDGGPARQGNLNWPMDVATDADQQPLVPERFHHRVRAVTRPLPSYSGDQLPIVDPDGRRVHLFDAAGAHQATLSARTGAVLWQFGYDDDGRLVTLVDGDGNAITVERDVDGTATRIVGPDGHANALVVADGLLRRVIQPADDTDGVWELDYAPGGLLRGFTDPEERGSTYTFAADGRLETSRDGVGAGWDLDRTERADGWDVAVESRLGRRAEYGIVQGEDTEVRRTVTMPDGSRATTTTTATGSLHFGGRDGSALTATPVPDPRFGSQAPSQDAVATRGTLSRSMRETRICLVDQVPCDPDEPFAATTLGTEVTVDGETHRERYDVATRTSVITTPEGRTVTATYDDQERPLRVVVPGTVARNYDWDARGRLTRQWYGDDPDAPQRAWHFGYYGEGESPGDAWRGWTKSVTAPSGRTVRYQYDAGGSVAVARLEVDGEEVSVLEYDHDDAGNLVGTTPDGKAELRFGYDAAGRLDDVAVEGVRVTDDYEYSDDGELETHVRPEGDVAYSYDAESGQLDRVDFDGGFRDWDYDPGTGLVSRLATGDVALSYEHDDGLVRSVTADGVAPGTVTLDYETGFRLRSTQVGDEAPVVHAYDRDGRLRSVGELAFLRDPDTGSLAGTTLGSLVARYGTDAFGASDTITVHHDDGSPEELLGLDVDRDAAGFVERRATTVLGDAESTEFRYDAHGRLAHVVDASAGVTRTYCYDANGNRVAEYEVAGADGEDCRAPSTEPVATGSVDAEDRLEQYGGVDYGYNGNGDLVTRTAGAESTVYDYDGRSQLRRVRLPDARVVEYRYDGLGRRVARVVDGTLDRGLLYQGRYSPVAQLDGAGAVLSRFVYATSPYTPDYLVRGGRTYQLVRDERGSIRLVVDAADGTVVQRLDYDEWGNLDPDTSFGLDFQPFGFAGGLHDHDTGLVRFGYRDYDPATGRFTTKDPIGRLGGPNPYLYAGADPVNRVDPTGLTEEGGGPTDGDGNPIPHEQLWDEWRAMCRVIRKWDPDCVNRHRREEDPSPFPAPPSPDLPDVPRLPATKPCNGEMIPYESPCIEPTDPDPVVPPVPVDPTPEPKPKPSVKTPRWVRAWKWVCRAGTWVLIFFELLQYPGDYPPGYEPPVTD